MNSRARLRSRLLDRLQAAARRFRAGATSESGTYPVVAIPESRRGEPPSSRPSSAPPPRLRELAASDADGMTLDERADLARTWAAEAERELAASRALRAFAGAFEIASAPAELVEDLASVADDALRRALLAASIAEGYGATMDRAATTFGDCPLSLVELADRLASQGCVEATLAAALSADRLARASDADERRVYAAMAGDHARRAEATWSALGWLASRNDETRAAAIAALAPCSARAISAALDDDAVSAWALGVVVDACARDVAGDRSSAA